MAINRVLIIGMGSAGKRHAEICNRLGREVRGWDVVGDWPPLDLDWPDAVFVCTPPDTHLPWAMNALYHGKEVFIEKPLGLPAERVWWKALLFDADKRRQRIAVGYQLRYHQEYKALMASFPEHNDDWRMAMLWYAHDLRLWRPNQDYRKGYICNRREEGGGIIMDASHELDVALWLFGRPDKVTCLADDGGIEGMHSEATALIRLDYTHQRRMCIVCLDGTLPEKQRGARVFFDDGADIRADGRNKEHMQAAYEDQDRRFLEGRKPISDGWSALETLGVIELCHKAIDEKKGAVI